MATAQGQLLESWKGSELAFANKILADHYSHCQQFLVGIAGALRCEIARLQDRSVASQLSQPSSLGYSHGSQDSIEGGATLTEDNRSEGLPYADWARSPELSIRLGCQRRVNPYPIFGPVEAINQTVLFARTRVDADPWDTDGLSALERAKFDTNLGC